MSFLGSGPKDPYQPGKTERENNAGNAGRVNPDEKDRDPSKPTTTRIAIWIIVSAVGLYFIGSGVWGILMAR